MNNRMTFTNKLCDLIKAINGDTEFSFRVALDCVKRTDHEQAWMFTQGASKDDGVHYISDHQLGLGADLLVYDSAGTYLKVWPPAFIKKYHDLWTTWGGRPMISWDTNHFGWPH